MQDLAALDQELCRLLGLSKPPLAIAFSAEAPAGVARFDAPFSAPAADGRRGRVPASCVFWVEAAERTFTTVPEDHGNCSVGSVTHGLRGLDEVSGHHDVQALLDSGWVRAEDVGGLPHVSGHPGAVTYGPLREAPVAPDVVLLRVNGKQAMLLGDAFPDLRFEGKPQCHVLPIAREQQVPAVSVGCMLSRVRTGLPNHEMTCALPGARLAELVAALRTACEVDATVAAWASEDAQRF